MDITSKTDLVTALNGLRTISNEKAEQEKKENLSYLFSDHNTDDKEKAYLVVSLKNMPNIPENGKVVPVSLSSAIPHGFYHKSRGILLVTKDDKKCRNQKADFEISINNVRNLLNKYQANDIVTEIMPLSKLRYDVNDFEAKRKLASQFELVLADVRVIKFVIPLLGKQFFTNKRFPVAVHMNRSDVRAQLKNAVKKSYLHFSCKGNCGTAQIGRMSQSDTQISSNILATLERWRKHILGGWSNVHSISLKTSTSLAIPLYRNIDPPDSESVNVKHPRAIVEETIAIEPFDFVSKSKRIRISNTGAFNIVSAEKKSREKMTKLNDLKRKYLFDRYDPEIDKVIPGPLSKKSELTNKSIDDEEALQEHKLWKSINNEEKINRLAQQSIAKALRSSRGKGNNNRIKRLKAREGKTKSPKEWRALQKKIKRKLKRKENNLNKSKKQSLKKKEKKNKQKM